MEWWYKSEKFKVTNENCDLLQDGMKDVMRQGNSISTASLYKDSDFFYIRTTNHFALNYFLTSNGFEQLEDEKPEAELVFGVKE